MSNATDNISLVGSLIKENKQFIEKFKKSALMQFVTGINMKNKNCRKCLLDCIQVFSDYFQKVVMLRYVLCDDKKYLGVSIEHLKEEFGHNLSLSEDRNHESAPWNPILEATAAWFTWKMFTLDNDEKAILVHLVLEASANIFFQAANTVMQTYNETDYFKIHSEVDEKHENMGVELMNALHPEKLERLRQVQTHSWDMLNTVCSQIVLISQEKQEIQVLVEKIIY